MIDVETLIRQIIPNIVLGRRSSCRKESGKCSNHGIRGAFLFMGTRLRAEPPARSNQIEKQDGAHGNTERCANHRNGGRVDGIGEGVRQDVNPPAKKTHREKAGQAPKGAREPAANDQGSARTQTQRVKECSAVHGSTREGLPVGKYRLRESQEIKILKDGRRIILLHDAAASATGIFPLDFAIGFHKNRATTRCIHTMPALARFHKHGPISSLRING